MLIKACSMVLPLHGGWTGFFWVKMVLLKSDQSFVEGSDDNCLMHSSHVLLRKAWSFCTYFVKGNNVCEFHFTSSLFCAAVVEIKSHHHSLCTSWKSVTFCAKSRSLLIKALGFVSLLSFNKLIPRVFSFFFLQEMVFSMCRFHHLIYMHVWQLDLSSYSCVDVWNLPFFSMMQLCCHWLVTFLVLATSIRHTVCVILSRWATIV